MPNAQEYRQQAEWCLDLANTATDQFSKESMQELASEFLRAADQLEQELSNQHTAA